MSATTYHHGNLKNALIQAGVEILAKEGVGSLSLRKVAKQAGVSHAAPYSHFKDKHALIAAISTEGFKQLYSQIKTVFEANQDQPESLLLETTWAYFQFALNETDSFKLMFSSALEKEKEYPNFVAVSHENFAQLVKIVEICQQGGVLKDGPSEIVAVSVWSTVHGFVSLFIEGQISHTVVDGQDLKHLLTQIINRGYGL